MPFVEPLIDKYKIPQLINFLHLEAKKNVLFFYELCVFYNLKNLSMYGKNPLNHHNKM